MLREETATEAGDVDVVDRGAQETEAIRPLAASERGRELVQNRTRLPDLFHLMLLLLAAQPRPLK
jgi:hypothetical protein